MVDSNNPRKVLPGTIDIKVMLRMPLMEHEYVTKNEKWAILDMTAKPMNTPQPPAPQQRQQSANKPIPSIQVPVPGNVPANKPLAPARGSSNIQTPNTASSPPPTVRSPVKTNSNLSSPDRRSTNASTSSSPVKSPVSSKSPTSAKSPVSAKTPTSAKTPVSAKTPQSQAAPNEELEKLIEEFEE